MAKYLFEESKNLIVVNSVHCSAVSDSLRSHGRKSLAGYIQSMGLQRVGHD